MINCWYYSMSDQKTISLFAKTWRAETYFSRKALPRFFELRDFDALVTGIVSCESEVCNKLEDFW